MIKYLKSLVRYLQAIYRDRSEDDNFAPIYFLDPQDERVAFVVPPKSGCTSIRHWLWQKNNGVPYIQKDHNKKIYEAIPLVYGKPLPDTVKRIVAVHREGVGRLRAVYDHRVKVQKDILDKGLLHFALTVPHYRDANIEIKHHAECQTKWLGKNHEIYTDIIPLKYLQYLPQVLAAEYESHVPDMPRYNKTDKKTILPWFVRLLFLFYTRGDRKYGWNGETMRGEIVTVLEKEGVLKEKKR